MTDTVKTLWKMQCPECGDYDNLRVEIKCMASLSINGTDTDSDHEWNNASPCACDACGWEGLAMDAERAATVDSDTRFLLGLSARLPDNAKDWQAVMDRIDEIVSRMRKAGMD